MDFYYIIKMHKFKFFFPWYDCESILMLKQGLTSKFSILIYQDFIILLIVYKVHGY
jgi:hypothetical protein